MHIRKLLFFFAVACFFSVCLSAYALAVVYQPSVLSAVRHVDSVPTGVVSVKVVNNVQQSAGTATLTATRTATPTAVPSPNPTPNPGGTAYYVDPAGNDSNAGTTASIPWRTVARVNSAALEPGDMVLFKSGGLWRETLNASGGVTFTAYGSGRQPIIDGDDVVPVSSWSQTPGYTNVYQATIASGTYIENLYVDPSSTTGGPTGPAAQPALRGDPGWGLMRACGLPETSVTTPGPMVGNPGVFGPDAGACQIGAMQAGTYVYYPSDVTPEARSGADAGLLYVELGDNSNPASHVIEISVRPYGLNGVGNVSEFADTVVDGLTFQHARGGMVFYSNNLPGQYNVTIENCTVRYTGTGQEDDSYNSGIIVDRGASPVVENNLLSYTGSHGNAVNLENASGAQYLNNRADHWNHNCMDSKNSANVLIQGNVCYDAQQPPSGSDHNATNSLRNGIYQEAPASASSPVPCNGCMGLVVEQNIVYNYSGAGILIDSSVGKGVKIYNNSIYNGEGIQVQQGGDIIRNNGIEKTLGSGAAIAFDYGATGTEDHNELGRTSSGRTNVVVGQTQSASDLQSDPMWVGAATGNFNLASGSPCINAGVNVGLPYKGLAPDLGAIESPY